MKPKILLVDDEPNIIYSYSRGLRKDWHMVTAMSGEEGLKAIDEQGPFQIIVSDFNMPHMDGITFLSRSMEKDPESIRMMLTGEGDFHIAMKAVNEGNIFRFITKPCPLENLEKALKDAYRQFRLTQVEKEARQQELIIAGEIQRNLLLENAPVGMPFFDIAAITVPSKSVDGDFIDFFTYSKDRFDLVVGDVMGKGLHAAMVGAGAKNLLARVLWQLALDHPANAIFPEQIMETFRRDLTPGLEQVQKFITMCYARFDSHDNKMTFVDAGHTPILWHSAKTADWISLKGENVPIGLPALKNCVQKTIKFATGDLFLFYSDGLMDGRNSAGEYYGDQALMNCLARIRHLPSSGILKALIEDNRIFTNGKELIDDLTVVAVKIR